MKKRVLLIGIFLAVVMPVAVFADTDTDTDTSSNLKVSVRDTYTGGETVLIEIEYTESDGSPVVLSDPKAIKITITKPDGTAVESVARHESWNGPGEYFDVYTIEQMGTYHILVRDANTNMDTFVTFDSVFYTAGSIGITIFAILMIVGCAAYLAVQKRRKR